MQFMPFTFYKDVLWNGNKILKSSNWYSQQLCLKKLMYAFWYHSNYGIIEDLEKIKVKAECFFFWI